MEKEYRKTGRKSSRHLNTRTRAENGKGDEKESEQNP